MGSCGDKWNVDLLDVSREAEQCLGIGQDGFGLMAQE
jgi:hypothetical protein